MNTYSSQYDSNINNAAASSAASIGDYLYIGPDTDKVAVHMGDGWCTFPDLDNFDSEKLLKALTLKVKLSPDLLIQLRIMK